MGVDASGLFEEIKAELAHAHIPSSTYRVQLTAGFRFADAQAIVPYLAQLGVGDLYTSPCLQAAAGSTHGFAYAYRGSADANGYPYTRRFTDAGRDARCGDNWIR